MGYLNKNSTVLVYLNWYDYSGEDKTLSKNKSTFLINDKSINLQVIVSVMNPFYIHALLNGTSIY